MLKSKLLGETINLLELEWKNKRDYLKIASKEYGFICPQCEKDVELHWAVPTKKIPHFKHKIKRDCIYGIGETDEHNKGKVRLYEYFKDILKHKIDFIEIEYFIPETKQIADIFIQFNNGKKWAIEYQRSNIQPEEIRKRKELYKGADIKDIWIAGENLVRDDGFAIKRISNAAQELIVNDLFNTVSLIIYNPLTDQINILRGLEKQNQNAYTFDYQFEHLLKDVRFNKWGEGFCIEDYLFIRKEKTKKITSFPFQMEVKDIEHANLRNRTYFRVNKDIFLIIPFVYWKVIPIEMKDLVLDVNFIQAPANPEESLNPMVVIGIYPSLWKEQIGKVIYKSPSFEESPARLGFLFSSLRSLYNHHYRSEDEIEIAYRYHLEMGRVPHYVENGYLKKANVIRKDILKNKFRDIVSIEECLEPFLNLMKVNFNTKDLVDQALKYNIIFSEELKLPFTVDLLLKMEDRVDEYLTSFPHIRLLNN